LLTLNLGLLQNCWNLVLEMSSCCWIDPSCCEDLLNYLWRSVAPCFCFSCLLLLAPLQILFQFKSRVQLKGVSDRMCLFWHNLLADNIIFYFLLAFWIREPFNWNWEILAPNLKLWNTTVPFYLIHPLVPIITTRKLVWQLLTANFWSFVQINTSICDGFMSKDSSLFSKLKVTWFIGLASLNFLTRWLKLQNCRIDLNATDSVMNIITLAPSILVVSRSVILIMISNELYNY